MGSRTTQANEPNGLEAGLVVKISSVRQAEQEARSVQKIAHLFKGTEVPVSEIVGAAAIPNQSGLPKIISWQDEPPMANNGSAHQVSIDPLGSPNQLGEQTVLTLMVKMAGEDIQGNFMNMTEAESIKVACQVATLFKASSEYLPQRTGAGFHWADDVNTKLPYQDAHQSFVTWAGNQLKEMNKVPKTEQLRTLLLSLYQTTEHLFTVPSQTSLWDMADRNIMVTPNYEVVGLIDQGGVTTGDPVMVVSFVDSMLRSSGFTHTEAYVEQWERTLGLDLPAHQRLAVMRVVDFASTWLKSLNGKTDYLPDIINEDELRNMVRRAKQTIALKTFGPMPRASGKRGKMHAGQ